MRKLEKMLDKVLMEIEQEENFFADVFKSLESGPEKKEIKQTVLSTESKKSPKHKRVYRCEVVDQEARPVQPIFKHDKFSATFPQHFTWCVKMYLDLLNSDKDKMGSPVMFISMLHEHPESKSVMVDSNALVVARALQEGSITQNDVLVPVIPQLKIPGIKKCSIFTEVKDKTKRTPIAQKMFCLPPAIIKFLNSITDPVIAIGHLQEAKWKGIERFYDDSSIERAVIIFLDEKVAETLRGTVWLWV